MQFDYNLVSFSWKKNQPNDLNTINTIENLEIKFKCFEVGVWWLKKCIRLEEIVPLKRTKAYKGGGEIDNFWQYILSEWALYQLHAFWEYKYSRSWSEQYTLWTTDTMLNSMEKPFKIFTWSNNDPLSVWVY